MPSPDNVPPEDQDVSPMAFERTPPQDVAAEQCVLGAMMLSASVAKELLILLRPEHFYRPAHAMIFRAIHGLVRANQPADAITVRAALMTSGDMERVGGAPYLHTLLTSVPTPANGSHYAGIVADRAILRHVVEAATRIIQHAYSPGGDSAKDVLDAAIAALMRLRDLGELEEDIAALTLAEFLAREAPEPEWVIPDLIERHDRVMITGPEGWGKSLLSQQIGASVASGADPFDPERSFTPGTTFVVDCENPPHLLRRRWERLRLVAQGLDRPIADSRCWIEDPPKGGLDLCKPAGRRWLLRRLEHLQPDLLVIGSLYKLHRSSINDELAARVLTDVLDEATAVCGTALVIEAHSPYQAGPMRERPIRPAGSSVFSRWPFIGFALMPVVPAKGQDPASLAPRLSDIVRWRGDRESRRWPDQLYAGAPWPWAAW